MNSSGFFALAEAAINYVDERFGRVAAWVMAVATVLLVPVALVGVWMIIVQA